MMRKAYSFLFLLISWIWSAGCGAGSWNSGKQAEHNKMISEVTELEENYAEREQQVLQDKDERV